MCVKKNLTKSTRNAVHAAGYETLTDLLICEYEENQNGTYSRIGSLTGCSTQSVRNWMRSAGIPPKKGNVGGPHSKPAAIKTAKMDNLIPGPTRCPCLSCTMRKFPKNNEDCERCLSRESYADYLIGLSDVVYLPPNPDPQKTKYSSENRYSVAHSGSVAASAKTKYNTCAKALGYTDEDDMWLDMHVCKNLSYQQIADKLLSVNSAYRLTYDCVRTRIASRNIRR